MVGLFFVPVYEISGWSAFGFLLQSLLSSVYLQYEIPWDFSSLFDYFT
jgi:hypothetical protein